MVLIKIFNTCFFGRFIDVKGVETVIKAKDVILSNILRIIRDRKISIFSLRNRAIIIKFQKNLFTQTVN